MVKQVFPSLFEKKNTNKNYLLWESIVLALLENFKFNFEILGTLPPSEDKNDIHPYQYLKQLKNYQAKEYYFNEKNHVHFNRFIAYGAYTTPYPMGESLAHHHFTLETYQFIWAMPLFSISNWQETASYIFSTDHNYFLESCNSVFLKTKNYLNAQSYPIITPAHKEYFTKKYFKETDLPPSLLLNNFSLIKQRLKIPNPTLKTLNFCLKIFQVAVLIQAALMEIFGKSKEKAEQIGYLQKNWGYPHGAKIKDLSLFRLNLLSFLYLSLHPAATVLCYGLYRNKYGTNQSHRTAFYVKHNQQPIALKDFLRNQVQNYIETLNKHLKKNRSVNNNLLTEIQEKTTAALDLARMYGIGYETNREKGINIHKNAPADFKPSELSASLQDINFVVEHSENSPLWRIFYDYCGEWWNKKEIEQVLEGTLINSPRSSAVHIFHTHAAHFWKDYLRESHLPQLTAEHIASKCRIILKPSPPS